MAKATIHDRLVAALQGHGETIVVGSRSARHTVITRTDRATGDSRGYYFIGKAGSLRVGRTKSESMTVNPKFRNMLLGMAAD